MVLSVREDSCTLCFDKRASVRLVPCGHEGFCPVCADQLAECPMCRASIHEVAHDKHGLPKLDQSSFFPC
uniref:RING-type domain-containing protein n=1 Tax=Timema douglasi TaxID=61478 RepID=A0A7R8Z9Y1_TIMDO|nr:unnamed protein product [Timema douglasi]